MHAIDQGHEIMAELTKIDIGLTAEGRGYDLTVALENAEEACFEMLYADQWLMD